MPTPYLALDDFKLRADLIQPEDVDLLESRYAGFVAQQVAIVSSYIDARLKKRYAVPFAAPVPEIVLGWVTTLVTRACWHRRGYNPQDPAIVELGERCTQAHAELKEAADSQDGLFDLPLSDAAGDSAVAQGSPLSYSEQSPFVWGDVQRDNAFGEDASGHGSFGGRNA